jgi:signal transduction histidine kinase
VTTVERALRVLIHDIRTPVGVAQGYLRLLQQERLGSGEVRERAFRHALQALDQLARLADDAERIVDEVEPLPRVAVSCQALVDRVCARLPASAVEVTGAAGLPPGVITAPPDVDRLAEAIAGVLMSAGDPAAPTPGAVTVGMSEQELWFATGQAAEGPPSGEPLDPWRMPGLALPAACRTVDQSGGRLWCRAGGAAGVGVAFTFEVSR